MGRVDCLSLRGCVCWFWSSDHLEPHFHVKSPGDWEVRVFFMEEPPYYDAVFEVRSIPVGKLNRFLKQVAKKREQLLKEWDAKVSVENP